ncbi:DASH complex subunit Dam1-domain-containing protein [Pyrenochaeta sp. MPI-SDFR-AT-0127]|nr:DASH complex subunit Dam1-domain-containing protein [Pyrenochaeta sp. MPI-SDFR-AT-0127]
MSSTTPTRSPPANAHRRTRSKSPLSRSRPVTPLRASSRSSLRDSAQRGRGASAAGGNALEGLQDGFAELSDAMADLEQNFMALQLMHESLARFSESFAGFLYGMNMNAFCVDFPEVCMAPIAESFKRPQNYSDLGSTNLNRSQGPDDMEATFLTTDTSFVDNPPISEPSNTGASIKNIRRAKRKRWDSPSWRTWRWYSYAWWYSKRSKRWQWDCEGDWKRPRGTWRLVGRKSILGRRRSGVFTTRYPRKRTPIGA